MAVVLTDGDITKRDDVLWGFTPDECISYFRHRSREVLFREAVLAFMGVGEDEAPQRRDQALGERCKGADLAECRRYFTDEEILKRVCSTCPN